MILESSGLPVSFMPDFTLSPQMTSLAFWMISLAVNILHMIRLLLSSQAYNELLYLHQHLNRIYLHDLSNDVWSCIWGQKIVQGKN